MPDNPDDLLLEYNTLRSEITQNGNHIVSIFLANTALTAGIFGFGLSETPVVGIVFLAPLAILIPSLFLIASQLEQITIISQYLRVVLEPKMKVKWQTRWYQIRADDLLPIKRRKYIDAVSQLYGTLAVICLCLAFSFWTYDTYIFVIIASLVVIPLMFAVRAIRIAFSMEFRRSVASAWKDLTVSESPPPAGAQSDA